MQYAAALQELSLHSGASLHHIAQLYSHGLMYHATLLISKGGVPLMRLMSAGAALADLLQGERHCWPPSELVQ